MNTLCSVKRICYNFSLFLLLFVLILLPSFFPSFSVGVYIFLTLLYFFNSIIKIFLFFVGLKYYKLEDYYKKDNLKISDNELPIYSILLPVRKEKEFVLINLLNSVYNLEYPKDKLDVKLIVDDNDFDTVGICKKLLDKFSFELVVVPTSNVMSKPMSCNYALKSVKGKYLAIYDAEDRPEKYQLRKAIQRFSELDDKHICLQASLNFYNKYDNFITYCFSIEYSMWFDFAIKAISRFASFFPLGGTSNHFKTDKLLELGGWDGYNVTEDAELGVRIVRAGYKVSILNSITEEECTISVKAWLRQRTRWIKGFMQTFFENSILRQPIGVKSSVKLKRMFNLAYIDIVIYLAFIMMSFMFFISIFAVFINHFIILGLRNFDFLIFAIYFNCFTLFFMIYGSFIIVAIKNKMKFNAIYFIFSPFYWILHYIAGIRAVKSLILSPFYWAKTDHGVSKTVKDK